MLDQYIQINGLMLCGSGNQRSSALSLIFLYAGIIFVIFIHVVDTRDFKTVTFFLSTSHGP